MSPASDLILRGLVDKATFFARVFSIFKFLIVVFVILCILLFI